MKLNSAAIELAPNSASTHSLKSYINSSLNDKLRLSNEYLKVRLRQKLYQGKPVIVICFTEKTKSMNRKINLLKIEEEK